MVMIVRTMAVTIGMSPYVKVTAGRLTSTWPSFRSTLPRVPRATVVLMMVMTKTTMTTTKMRTMVVTISMSPYL